MPEVLGKVRQIKAACSVPVEIDGGINAETAPLAAKAGVDIFVAGSFACAPDVGHAGDRAVFPHGYAELQFAALGA